MDVRELYQQLIIDHGRHPRNFKCLDDANHTKEGFNPLCGDKLTVYIKEQAGIIQEVCFKGDGCAISMASASLMTEALKGKTIDEVEQLFNTFHRLVAEDNGDAADPALGKLVVLAGVAEYPARVKCATLAWHTLMAALKDSNEQVSTE